MIAETVWYLSDAKKPSWHHIKQHQSTEGIQLLKDNFVTEVLSVY